MRRVKVVVGTVGLAAAVWALSPTLIDPTTDAALLIGLWIVVTAWLWYETTPVPATRDHWHGEHRY